MKPKRSESVSWRMVEGEGVLLHLKTGAYYSLNEVGTKIWELCNGKNTSEQIGSSVCSKYKSEQDLVMKDVGQLLAKLFKEKLIEFAK